MPRPISGRPSLASRGDAQVAAERELQAAAEARALDRRQGRLVAGDERAALWDQERKTVLFVTHSVEEAIYLADRIVVMSARPGRIETVVAIDDPRPRDLLRSRSVELRRDLTRLVEAQVTFAGPGRTSLPAYAD